MLSCLFLARRLVCGVTVCCLATELKCVYLQCPTELHCVCIVHHRDAEVGRLKELLKQQAILKDLTAYPRTHTCARTDTHTCASTNTNTNTDTHTHTHTYTIA